MRVVTVLILKVLTRLMLLLSISYINNLDSTKCQTNFASKPWHPTIRMLLYALVTEKHRSMVGGLPTRGLRPIIQISSFKQQKRGRVLTRALPSVSLAA